MSDAELAAELAELERKQSLLSQSVEIDGRAEASAVVVPYDKTRMNQQ